MHRPAWIPRWSRCSRPRCRRKGGDARSEIWWATLPAPIASEPGYRRPVLIIQADAYNASRINTVIVIAITSNLALAQARGNVLLSVQASGSPKKSVANVSQVITLDKSFLDTRIQRLASREFTLVEDGLRRIMSL